MINSAKQQNFHQIAIYVLGLGVLLVGAYRRFTVQLNSFVQFSLENKIIATTLIITAFFTIIWHITMLRSYLLREGQGSKISDLSEDVKRIGFIRLTQLHARSFIVALIPCVIVLLFPVKNITLLPFLSIIQVKGAVYLSTTLALASLISSFKVYKIKNFKEVKREINNKRLPKKDKNKVAICTIGEDQGSVDEKELKQPLWVYMGRKALKGNVGIIGGTGKGKTASVFIPIMIQVLSVFKDISLYINDSKGTLYEIIKPFLLKSGRKIHRFCFGSDWRFNPIYSANLLKDGRYELIASSIKYASINVLGSSDKSKFWEAMSYQLTILGLIMCHLKYDYYTINTLRAVMVGFDKDSLPEFNELYKRNINKFNEEEQHNIKMALISLEEYVAMDRPLRTSILASATAFINLFNDYQVSKIFCPKKEEINLTDLSEIIDDNCIIFTQFKSRDLSRGLGTFLRVLWKEAAQDVYYKRKDDPRLFGQFLDEYHKVSTKMDGEDFAENREFEIFSVIAFQHLDQLISKLGDKSSMFEVMDNIHNKICLATTNEETIKYYKHIAAKHTDTRISEGFSENTQDAEKNWLDGGFLSGKINVNQSFTKYSEEKDHLTDKDINRLKAFEGYGYFTDGINSQFYKIFTKPYFLDERTPHKKVLELVGRGEECLPVVS